jgi:hypothetical protein
MILSRGSTSGCYLSTYGAMAGRLRFFVVDGHRIGLVGTGHSVGVKQSVPSRFSSPFDEMQRRNWSLSSFSSDAVLRRGHRRLR